MAKFKIGDKVVCIQSEVGNEIQVGWTGVIDEESHYPYVRWDNYGDYICLSESRLAYAHESPVEIVSKASAPEYTGGSSSYYKVNVVNPVSHGDPYEVECQDIIEALGMNFGAGNIFKAIWRICAAKKGKAKKGYVDSVYDLEKIIFFAQRELELEKLKAKG